MNNTYTCKGKGGLYELIGVTYGAGTLRGKTFNEYREVTTGVRYVREPADFQERMELAERATTASAAPTTVQMPETWDYNVLHERMEPRAGGGFIHISDARTYGAARAEEARREARAEEADKLAEVIAQKTEYVALAERYRQELAAAQRMAGGDAVQAALKAFMAFANMRREEIGCLSDEFEAVYEQGRSALAAWPVAEAVAQADDGLLAELKLDPRSAEIMAAMPAWKRDLWNEHSAAPTAQPTPAFPPRDLAKPAEQQGIFEKFQVLRTDGSSAPGGKHHGCAYFVLDLDHDQHAPAAMRAYAASCRATHPALATDIEARYGAAQPTPPDDERAAFEAWAGSVGFSQEQIAAREGDGYEESWLSEYWACWRAALRQPGALPDEAAIVAAVHAASATGRVALTVVDQDGTERPTNVATCFVRALAAKQAGKEA